MKKQFSPEQVVRILNKARIGAKNSGISTGDVRKLKALEEKTAN